MNRLCLCGFCICMAVFSACSPKTTEHEGMVKLPKFGVSLKIPEGFKPVPPEKLKDMEISGATVLQVEPFTVIPQYGYADSSGKGAIIVSELQFSEGSAPWKYPMDNIYVYQKNLEAFFGAGEISNEEINGNDITTVLLAMVFTETDGDISLFKGLSYTYPDRFFMIDLCAVNAKITREDALGFQHLFNSIGLL